MTGERTQTDTATCSRFKVTIYTDGASKGNPGPGGYGAILTYQGPDGMYHTKELSAGYQSTTNNRMELMALIVALEQLKRPCKVLVVSDSQYVIKAFTEHWIESWIVKGWKTSNKQPVKNKDLWQRLLAAADPHDLSFEWVKGHNNHPQNERCDALASGSAELPYHELLIDEGANSPLSGT